MAAVNIRKKINHFVSSKNKSKKFFTKQERKTNYEKEEQQKALDLKILLASRFIKEER